MKYINRIIAVLLILGAIFAALYYIPSGRDVDISMPCVIWDIDDPTVGEPEGMKIKGKYYDYLIKEDRFRGSIRISEVNDYEEELELELRLSDHRGMYRASIYYFSRVHRRTILLGSLFMQGKFDKVLIFLSGDGPNAQLNDKVLSAPATTIEEAMAIAEEMNFA